MRGQVLHLDLWDDPGHQVPDLVYLDACDWQLFRDWVSNDQQRLDKLANRTWQVRTFNTQLNQYFGANGQRTKSLKELGVDLDGARVRHTDELFLNEVQWVYFGNEPNCRRRAELLALARRQTPNGRLCIISQHRGFWRNPLVDVYYVGTTSLVGNDVLPAAFDFLSDFAVHRTLAQAVRQQMDIGENGQILLDAIIALRDHVRTMSSLATDGIHLMDEAFRQDGSVIRVNPLTNQDPRSSQQNEQRGFRELYCAVITGLRNPITHEGATSQFAKERLPDKQTLLKYLSLLSILCERADHPMHT